MFAGQLDLQPRETIMAKKKTTKPDQPEAATPAEAPETGKKRRAKKAKPPKEKKLSALDAAVKVLGEEKRPMTTGELIEAMATKGYWKSPGGLTPGATL